LDAFGVGVVIRSECPDVKTGDHVYGYLSTSSLFLHFLRDLMGPVAMEEYSIRKSMTGFKILSSEIRLPWSVYVGAAGMPGTFQPLVLTPVHSMKYLSTRENCSHGLERIFTRKEGEWNLISSIVYLIFMMMEG
jgi:hypothetical protein